MDVEVERSGGGAGKESVVLQQMGAWRRAAHAARHADNELATQQLWETYLASGIIAAMMLYSCSFRRLACVAPGHVRVA
jgi:hypothetical protein